jgi:hypothetical protein
MEEGDMMNQTKSEEVVNFSLRLPEQLYKSIVSISKSKKYSINQTIKLLLEQRLEQNKKQELWEAFSAISKENQDVDYGFSAQQEIMEIDV